MLEGPTQQHLPTQVIREIESWIREGRRPRSRSERRGRDDRGRAAVTSTAPADAARRRGGLSSSISALSRACFTPRRSSDSTRFSRSRGSPSRARRRAGAGRARDRPRSPRGHSPRAAPAEDLERPSDQRRALSLLCARLRLSRLLTELETAAARFPAALLESLTEDDIELLRSSAPERGFPSLDTVQIVVRGEGRNEEWRFGWRRESKTWRS